MSLSGVTPVEENGSNCLVSVIMTVHNGAPHIQGAVASVLDQSYRHFELVVVDDESTDDSIPIVKSFHDPRIRIVEMDRRLGRTPALNVAVNAAQGQFVAILDSDDLAYPKRLACQVAYLSDHPEVALAAGNVDWFDAEGRVALIEENQLSDVEVVWKLLFANILAHSSVMMRRGAIMRLGGYDETFRFGEDYHLYCAMLRQGYRLVYLRQKIGAIRLSSGSMTGTSGHLARLANARTRLCNLRYFLPKFSDGQLEGISDLLGGNQIDSEEVVKDTLNALMHIYSALLSRQPVDSSTLERIQADLARRIATLGWANRHSMPQAAHLADSLIEGLVAGSGRRKVYNGLSEACVSLALAGGKQCDKRSFTAWLRLAINFLPRGTVPVITDRRGLARLLTESAKTSLRQRWWGIMLVCGVLACTTALPSLFRKCLALMTWQFRRATGYFHLRPST